MMPFEKCPVCCGDLVAKQVEKIVRGGDNTAILHVHAEVCLHCGERLYAAETVKKFERVRQQLERRETDAFQPLGRTFQVA